MEMSAPRSAGNGGTGSFFIWRGGIEDKDGIAAVASGFAKGYAGRSRSASNEKEKAKMVFLFFLIKRSKNHAHSMVYEKKRKG